MLPKPSEKDVVIEVNSIDDVDKLFNRIEMDLKGGDYHYTINETDTVPKEERIEAHDK